MAEIPSQLSFEHMLSHVFPGFFTAVTAFMELDIWSPLHLVQYVINDPNVLIVFAAYVLIGGTILGVVIDGIHHKILEEIFLEKYPKNIEIHDIEEWLNCAKRQEKNNNECKRCRFLLNLDYEPVKIYYMFNMDSLEKYLSVYEYINKRYYHYYEFFANTSIALLPFSFVAPIYINQELGITHDNAVFCGFLLMILAFSCFWISITAYDRYISALYFIATRCRENKNDCDNYQFIHPIIVG
jgi:hypothetical protein